MAGTALGAGLGALGGALKPLAGIISKRWNAKQAETFVPRIESLCGGTGLEPGRLAQIAEKDPAVLSFFEDPAAPMPQTLLAEVEKAIIYSDDRAVKMTFKETGVDPSFTDRPQLRAYLDNFDKDYLKSLKYSEPDSYLNVLKKMVQKIFPYKGEIRFRNDGGVYDYEHLLTDRVRQNYIHSLPRTLKNKDITVEFTTPDGAEKAYWIKKYFDLEIQKDIWDILVIHDGELKTKIVRESYKGLSYTESLISKSADEAAGILKK